MVSKRIRGVLLLALGILIGAAGAGRLVSRQYEEKERARRDDTDEAGE